MPSIHPSESPPLGLLVPCLAVADLESTAAFYEKLDFVRYGGSAAEKWLMLHNRANEIHLFEGHIPVDLLNLRGGDLPAVRKVMGERGLVVDSDEGPMSFIYRDPDGREVFFDSSPEETEGYLAGRILTLAVPDERIHEGTGLDLGNLACCLACKDLTATSRFYETLGFVPSGGAPAQGKAILSRIDHVPAPGKRMVDTYLSLFQDMIPSDVLNFRGGNVGEIAGMLETRGVDLEEGLKTGADGGEYLLVFDPDGRGVFFDTTPPERLYES